MASRRAGAGSCSTRSVSASRRRSPRHRCRRDLATFVRTDFMVLPYLGDRLRSSWPHPDLDAARGHLGELDEPCAITLGREGRPLYVARPFDDPIAIMEALSATSATTVRRRGVNDRWRPSRFRHAGTPLEPTRGPVEAPRAPAGFAAGHLGRCRPVDADERTRTSTELPPHGPEPCASTNSATSAGERATIPHGRGRGVRRPSGSLRRPPRRYRLGD